MKARVHSILFLFFIAFLGMGFSAKAQVRISVYANIPLAPNINLTIGAPVIAAPAPDYVWIDGYWSWDDYYREYVWVQGYWARAPYRDAYWIPGYWEFYGNGYRWINAYWSPRNIHIRFGYYNGRYDYFGRPVYYHRPHHHRHYGYVYSYDHNPKHRGRGYNSSSYFNETPRNERDRINKSSNIRQAATTRSRQDVSQIRRVSGESRSAVRSSQNTVSERSSSRSNANVSSSSGSRSNSSRQSVESSQSSRSNSRSDANVSSSSGSRSNSSRQSVESSQSSSRNNNTRLRSNSDSGSRQSVSRDSGSSSRSRSSSASGSSSGASRRSSSSGNR
ncbi:MAG: YXWGXW repeat-containing protein [Dysgonamonadaceae bacterium]|nr:YXWGXW repeat-containing protein [Dysgonamonadaceae bacterium]